MYIYIDNGTWRPFRIGKADSAHYQLRHAVLQVLRSARRPLTNLEIAERISPAKISSRYGIAYISKALVHLETGGLVVRHKTHPRLRWTLTRTGRRAWKQIGALRAQRLEELKRPQVVPHQPIDPERYNLVYVRINLTGERRFDFRIVPMRNTLVRGIIERENLVRAFLREKLDDSSVAQVLRLGGQSCTIELADGGLDEVHILADELEDLLNRDAVYYVYPWNRDYDDSRLKS